MLPLHCGCSGGRNDYSRLWFYGGYLLSGSCEMALDAGLKGIARMIKKASGSNWVIGRMGRRNEGRMTVLEAIMGQCERERGYLIDLVVCFVGLCLLSV